MTPTKEAEAAAALIDHNGTDWYIRPGLLRHHSLIEAVEAASGSLSAAKVILLAYTDEFRWCEAEPYQQPNLQRGSVAAWEWLCDYCMDEEGQAEEYRKFG